MVDSTRKRLYQISGTASLILKFESERDTSIKGEDTCTCDEGRDKYSARESIFLWLVTVSEIEVAKNGGRTVFEEIFPICNSDSAGSGS